MSEGWDDAELEPGFDDDDEDADELADADGLEDEDDADERDLDDD